MPRQVLDESRIHPAIRDKIAAYRSDILKEVQDAIAANDFVVGAPEPLPEEGAQASRRRRHPVQVPRVRQLPQPVAPATRDQDVTGWPTYPLVFVKGTLIGGFSDLEKLVQEGKLTR